MLPITMYAYGLRFEGNRYAFRGHNDTFIHHAQHLSQRLFWLPNDCSGMTAGRQFTVRTVSPICKHFTYAAQTGTIRCLNERAARKTIEV
jgi:hypothetical protein